MSREELLRQVILATTDAGEREAMALCGGGVKLRCETCEEIAQRICAEWTARTSPPDPDNPDGYGITGTTSAPISSEGAFTAIIPIIDAELPNLLDQRAVTNSGTLDVGAEGRPW